jgi:hypothetical protein
MNKVTVEIKLRVLLHVSPETNFDDIINKMEYDLSDTTGNADVIDTELINYEVLDSR